MAITHGSYVIIIIRLYNIFGIYFRFDCSPNPALRCGEIISHDHESAVHGDCSGIGGGPGGLVGGVVGGGRYCINRKSLCLSLGAIVQKRKLKK